MKLLNITTLILLLLLIPGCGKDSTEPVTKGLVKKAEPKPPVDPIDLKTVLSIDEAQYRNKDFKRFIRIQYAGIAGTAKPNPRLISRLFDSYVEHTISSYAASKNDIVISQEEYDGYVLKVNVPDSEDPLNADAVKEIIRVQKFLYAIVYEGIEVTQKEINDYYNKNLDLFRKKGQVELHQILVKDRATALKIRGELKNAPRSFGEIAGNKSISMEAKKGGAMGFFEKGTLPEDMEKVVFSLRINSISPVIKSSYGFHIFKVTKKKKERLLFRAKVSPKIKIKLMQEKLRTAYEQFLARSYQQMKIIINHNALYIKYHPVSGPTDNPVEGQNTGSNKGDDNNETSTSPNNHDTYL